MTATPDLLSCDKCAQSVLRDDFPAHQRDCRGARPKLPVAGYLVRVEGDRVRVLTLGPGPFGAVLILGTSLIDVSFAAGDEGRMVAYILQAIEEQRE